MVTQSNNTVAAPVVSDNASNHAELVDIGARAVVAWNKSEREGAKGNALAIYALVKHTQVSLFQATVFDKNDEPVAYRSFELTDYIDSKANPPRADDGKVWRAMQSAMLNAVCKQVFNLEPDQITNAIKTRLAQNLPIVGNLLANVDPEAVTLSPRGSLCVPMELMVARPDPEKAKESVIEAYARDIGSSYVLDGSQGRTIADLGRKVKPEGDKRAPQTVSDNTDKPKAFAASIAFTTACVQSFIGDDGECDIAPTDTLDASLWLLKASLDAYFEANGAPVAADVIAA